MSSTISLVQRSEANEKLASSIIANKEQRFYECTIHNMYYSVYQRMKALLCLKNLTKENYHILHTNRTTKGIEEKGILNLCKDYIEAIDNDENKLHLLYKARNLYRARIKYDYKKANYIDEKQYTDYYNMMREVNNYLDKYIN